VTDTRTSTYGRGAGFAIPAQRGENLLDELKTYDRMRARMGHRETPVTKNADTATEREKVGA
jgi:hypothetical protein